VKAAPLLEIVVTARPSWARVKTVLYNYAQFYGAERVKLALVGPAVSQRYGDISLQIDEKIQVNTFPALHDSDSLEAVALTCIEGANALARHWANKRPDCVIVIADRTETLGVSMTAAIMQIPLIHIQGGEISGSIDDKIRDTNSKLADLHLTTNVETRERLIRLGEASHTIFITGCPSIDLVENVLSDEDASQLNHDKLIGVGMNFSLENSFGIIMFHPDTLNDQDNLRWVNSLIEAISSSELNWFWFWPNPDHGTNIISRELRKSRELGLLSRVKFIINLSPEDFIKLASKSEVLVGNSSFGIREASYLGLPVINIGKRQNGRQKSDNVLNIEKPVDSSTLSHQIESHRLKEFPKSFLYGEGNAGEKIARIIGGWVPQVKKRIP